MNEFDELNDRVRRLEAVMEVMVESMRTIVTAYELHRPDSPGLPEHGNPFVDFVNDEGKEQKG